MTDNLGDVNNNVEAQDIVSAIKEKELKNNVKSMKSTCKDWWFIAKQRRLESVGRQWCVGNG